MRPFVFTLVIGIALAATDDISAQLGDGPPPDPAAVRAVNRRFAGVWKLVGEDTRDANGQIVSRSPDASRFGYIVYDPAGYVGVTLSWITQPTFAGGRATTAQEALTALGTYN